MSKPTVSVILTTRNEWPIITQTMYSHYEELRHFGYEFEIIVVDNMSTDHTPAILRDRFRRWVRAGLLKVIEYNEKPANVTVRNIGVRAASGDVCVIGDAHISVDRGTVHAMIDGWTRVGGLWHSATHIWGDTSDIKCYGYSLKLEQKFWGNLSRGIPPRARTASEAFRTPPAGLREKYGSKDLYPHKVPMASHCTLLAGRKEYLDLGGYSEHFRCYGGGEPYLDLLYWIMGKEVWIEPRGLFRHAFGLSPHWDKPSRDKEAANAVWTRSGELKKKLKAGEEYLRYSRKYAWNNEMLHHNFMLSAYIIGGYAWLKKMYDVYYEQRKVNSRYVRDLNQLRHEVLQEGEEARQWVEKNQKRTLDQLLVEKPWEV